MESLPGGPLVLRVAQGAQLYFLSEFNELSEFLSKNFFWLKPWVAMITTLQTYDLGGYSVCI